MLSASAAASMLAGFEAEEGFADGYNTSAILWEAGGAAGAALAVLHDALRPEVFECLMRWDHWVEMVVPSAHLLQDMHPELFVDYRQACRGRAAPPPRAAVVCFPRSPKPHEVTELAWVREHWK